MDELVRTALLGTGRRDGAQPATGTPVDLMIEAWQGGNRERRLLVQAGALAIYRQAGYVPAARSASVGPAPDDAMPLCSPGVASLIAEMLRGRHRDLLPEALRRLRQAGLRLPPALLPYALNVTSPVVREALLPVLGERGCWLGQFRSAWNWATAAPPADAETIPEDAVQVWEEGMAGQRLDVLRRVRRADPDRAREWIAGVWKKEKAEFRREMVAVLEIGLSAGDEPLLETALNDRAVSVRAGTAALLACLPGSALAVRMRERAAAMIGYSSREVRTGLAASLRSFVAGEDGSGRIEVTMSDTLDDQAERDGIDPVPPEGMGVQAWWLQQVLARVPCRYWEQRWNASPDTLARAAAKTAWTLPLLMGWAQAAMTYHDVAWATPLWEQLYRATNDPAYRYDIAGTIAGLTRCCGHL